MTPKFYVLSRYETGTELKRSPSFSDQFARDNHARELWTDTDIDIVYWADVDENGNLDIGEYEEM